MPFIENIRVIYNGVEIGDESWWTGGLEINTGTPTPIGCECFEVPMSFESPKALYKALFPQPDPAIERIKEAELCSQRYRQLPKWLVELNPKFPP